MGKPIRIIYKGQGLLPVKRDIVFKAVLVSDGDLELLASLLSSILGIGMKAEDLTVTNTELPAVYEADKLSRMDIRVKTADNKHINVEIQISDEHDMDKRSLKYLSRMYLEQMKSSMDYIEAGRAIAINILDFKYLRSEKYHTQFRMMETEEKYELTDVFEINFIELPKLPRRKGGNMENNSANNLDMKEMWTMFLSADSQETLDMLAAQHPIFAKALGKLIAVSADEKLRFELEMREKAESDYNSGMKSSARREAEKTKLEIAKKMISRNTPPELIAEFTDIPLEKIEAMYNDTGK